MKKEAKTYTADDFARYYAGTMPAGEMHALEKAALEDPFLAEALEGYAYSDEPREEAKEIRERLHDAAGQRPSAPYIFNQWSWLKVAALIVLILGAGILYLLTKKHDTPSLADKQSTIQQDSTLIVAQLHTDTLPGNLVLESGIAKGKKEYPQHLPVPRSKKQATVEKTVDTNNPQTNPSDSFLAKSDKATKNTVAAELLVQRAAVQQPKRDELQSVVKNNGNHLDSHLPKIISTDTGVAYFDNGTKEKKSVVYAEDRGNGKLKLKENNSLVLFGKSNNAVLRTLGASPDGGFSSFNKYVKDSARVSTDSLGVPVKGKVVLSFNLDSLGRPLDVAVVQSNCGHCDEEAIRLLANGPRWIGPADKKLFVTIWF